MRPHVLPAILLAACAPDPKGSSNPETQGQDGLGLDSAPADSPADSGSSSVGLAMLQGYVQTPDGAPVPDAEISVGDATAITNGLGFFTLHDLPPGDVVVHATAAGFSSASAVRTLVGDAWSYVGLNVAPAEVLSWDTAIGGALETSDGVQIVLPDGGLVDGSGARVTGVVNVAVTLLNSASSVKAAPGALMGSQYGEDVLLKTLGMIEVQLTDGAGQPVQIAEPARISFPLGEALGSVAGYTLFGFDESTGRWQEAGESSIAAGRFMASVEHFSWWGSHRREGEEQCVSGLVVTSDGPLEGGYLSVEEAGVLTRGSYRTGRDGSFIIPLPAGAEVQISLEYGAYTWESDLLTLPDTVVPRTSRPVGCVDLGEVLALSEDEDDDGYPSLSRGGPDCDDDDATVSPDAVDAVYSGVDEDCDGEDDYDQDQDAYVPDEYVGLTTVYLAGSGALPGGDCDDTDLWTNPGRVEFCDGDDDNCTGDETDATDAQTWYEDQDADGYGADASATRTCADPGAGWVTVSGDCADTGADPALYHPGADEACGELIDYNCDGSVDDTDADADGVLACDDCDDGNALASPDATEVCDGLDNDCDGEIDAEAVDALTFYRDYDADGFGDGATSWTSCEAPAGYVLDAGSEAVDCDDTDADTYPDAPELCADGEVQDCAGSVAEAKEECAFTGEADLSGARARLLGEEDGDCAGQSLALAGDVNGDGWPDLIVGAPEHEPSTDGADRGAAYLLLGPVTSDSGLSRADAKLTGKAPGDQAGLAVAGDGDIDGDGYADLVVGAPYNGEDAGRAGVTYLNYGPVTGEIAMDSGDAKMLGGISYEEAGAYVAVVPDANDDGFDEVLVGSNHIFGGGGDGRIYLNYGPILGEMELSGSDVTFTAESGSAIVCGPGDVDGDGLGDLLMGDMSYSYSSSAHILGAANLVLGPASTSMRLWSADVVIPSEDPGDEAGSALGAPGDVNGDGLPDLLVGAYYHEADGVVAGAAYLVLAPATGLDDLGDASAKMIGENRGDHAGGSVSGAGDADGDGFADMLVGASAEDSGGTSAGAVYLVLGPVTGVLDLADANAKLIGEYAGDHAGVAVASAGDGDGDGRAEQLIGAYDHEEGAAYVTSVAGY